MNRIRKKTLGRNKHIVVKRKARASVKSKGEDQRGRGGSAEHGERERKRERAAETREQEMTQTQEKRRDIEELGPLSTGSVFLRQGIFNKASGEVRQHDSHRCTPTQS